MRVAPMPAATLADEFLADGRGYTIIREVWRWRWFR